MSVEWATSCDIISMVLSMCILCKNVTTSIKDETLVFYSCLEVSRLLENFIANFQTSCLILPFPWSLVPQLLMLLLVRFLSQHYAAFNYSSGCSHINPHSVKQQNFLNAAAGPCFSAATSRKPEVQPRLYFFCDRNIKMKLKKKFYRQIKQVLIITTMGKPTVMY